MLARWFAELFKTLSNDVERWPTVLVFGAPRSGTNYLEELILQNFFCRVANLNREVSWGLEKSKIRPWLYQSIGSKHSFKALENLSSHNSTNIPVVIYRAPESWVNARARYHLTYVNDNEEEVFRLAPAWIKNEFNKFYQLASVYPVIKYEDVAKKPETVESLLETARVSKRPAFKVLTKEILPGGVIGSGSVVLTKPNVFSTKYFQSNLKNIFDEELLSRLEQKRVGKSNE